MTTQRRPPAVEVDGDDVRISEVVIQDPVLADLLEPLEPGPRTEMLADVVEVGARMVQRHHDGQSGDLIRRELENVRERLFEAIEAMLSGAGQGFANAVRPTMDQIAQELGSIGGRLDGALALSNAQVQLETERERGTAKGRTFEQEVAAAVQAVANHNGDSCEHVGDVSSLAGRAGDVVVEIGGGHGPSMGRIVFEAKTGRLSRPEALRELERARETRDAEYAVMVVPRTDKMPAQVREFHEYGGDKMVVVFDHASTDPAVGLEVGYTLARARVLMSKSVRGDGVDASTAMSALEDAVQHLERVRSIKGKLTTLARASEEIGADLDGIASTVRSCLDRAAEALRGSE